MKAREIIFGKDAQDRITRGLEKTAHAVKSTLGPRGKNVLIQTPTGYQFTKDGITVAKNVEFSDAFENMGAQLAREAGNRSVRAAGDGPQPLYAKVLTPNGYVTIADLKVGDTICGTAGTFQKVEGVFPKGVRKLLKVKLSDGRVAECCEDHLWSVVDYFNKPRTLSTKEIIDNGLRLKHNNGHRYFVPVSHAEFETKAQALDPYLVGLLLGDGSLTGTGSIELSLGYKKEHVLEKIRLPEGLYIKATKVPSKNYIRAKIQGTTPDGGNIYDILGKMGLLGVSSLEKSIPRNYLYGDREQRTQLLQGLIDTNGHVNERGLAEFSSFSKQLADDVLELYRSLGFQTWSGTVDRKGYSSNPSHRVFQLKGNKHGVAIEEIEDTGASTEMMCIKVSNPDHLYFTDSYVLTHNTTTTITLLNAIVQEGKRQISLGTDPMSLRRGIDAACAHVVKWVESQAVPVKGIEDLLRVATISANGDAEIGRIIADTLDKVGADATVTLEEGKGNSTKVTLTKGFEFDRGMITEHFLRDFEKQRTVYGDGIEDGVLGQLDARFGNPEDPRSAYVWLINGRLGSLAQAEVRESFTAILNMVHQTNVPLLIVAEAVEGDALKLLAQNAMRGILNVVAVRAPGFGQDRRDLMEDLATATGAKVRRTDAGDSLFEGFSLAELGTARFVQVGLDKTIIIPPDSQVESIESRVEEIDARLAVTTEEDFRHILTRRRSMLTGGVANIIVGGRSDAEVREKRDLYEDALLSARAAASSGIVPGAGTMLIRASDTLADFRTGNDEQNVGIHILRKALLVPFQEIIKNGGGSAEVVLHNVRETGDKHAGYDSNRNEYCNLLERGIIDPARVIVSEIEHACSMAGLLLSTDVVIGFAEEPDLIKALSASKAQAV